jgi:hypothetical protein
VRLSVAQFVTQIVTRRVAMDGESLEAEELSEHAAEGY